MTNILSSKSVLNTAATTSPKRPIQKKQNKLGPYNLLQTLGEGEFGKVKLGIHIETGQEVAIKLIKKEGAGSDNRISKVEREISVLKTLNHPYIVKLYNVIETEKYIGIILEYASGGELFEYILAHRYLKEKDAKRFFAQLMSSVQYMHKRKIVHRDLKLENLLLDKDRNIIVTDFGFANQFSSAADDLMATTCGSPCYAAPELVVNAGLYAGSAVDIWSCGVILYAMLCGFLPFDDDPSNPDSDNINQLYRYILSTNLVFPTHVSPDARDLLDKMLVADPTKRCTLDYVIKHPWLESYRSFLKKNTTQVEMEASYPLPDVKKKANLMISGSVSTSLPKKATTTEVAAPRKTHVPTVSRDRFAPVANDKYLATDPKPNNAAADPSAAKATGTFKHFSIGRSTATTTTNEKQIHTTNPAIIGRSSKVPNIIARKPIKQEDDSSIPTTSDKESANLDQAVNPEKSLSSPLNTDDSKPISISAFGSIRRGQRRGTDKFLSFFTGGRSSQVPTVTKKQEGVSSIFDEGKQKNDVFYARSEADSNPAIAQETTEDTPQNATISYSNEIAEAEEQLPNSGGVLHSSSEASASGGSTPSLCPSSPLNSVADPPTPLSPTFTPNQNQVNLKIETIEISIHSGTNSQEESSHQTISDVDVHNTSSIAHGDDESESYESPSRRKSSPVRDRGNSISTTSILSERQGSTNSGNVSFKDAPRRASPLITRQTKNHQLQQIDSDSSLRSISIDQDSNSVSSYGPHPEASNSSRLIARSVENGGRQIMTAVRRSIYRKHKSQPPPQQHTEQDSHYAATTKEPNVSFAKSRFEETDAAPKHSHRDRNTWSAATRSNSISHSFTNKRKMQISATTATNNLSPTIATPKKGNKMMDWIKKKSYAKETKKETNATITPKPTASKLNPSAQILTRSKKTNSIKKQVPPAAVTVVATPIEKSTTKVPAPSSSFTPKAKVLATNRNRKNVVPTQHATENRIANQNVVTNTTEQTTKVPVSPIAVPERQISIRNKRAISGSETAFADLAKKVSDDDHIQVHQGAIDRTALTSQSPALVIKEIMRILRILGIDAHLETPFVLKCCRRKAKSFIAAQLLRKKQDEDDEGDQESGEEEEEEDLIDESSAVSSGISSSAMQITPEKGLEPIYGDASIDNGDEIRFAVEICRFKNLPGIYIVDIRRLRGNVWAYKFLYHKLIDFLDLEKNSYLTSSN